MDNGYQIVEALDHSVLPGWNLNQRSTGFIPSICLSWPVHVTWKCLRWPGGRIGTQPSHNRSCSRVLRGSWIRKH